MISKVSTTLALLAFALQSSAQISAYGQCGGNNWSGATTCVSGFTCKFSSEWYSQCVPGTGGSSPTTTAKTTIKPSSTIQTITVSSKTSTTSVKSSAAPISSTVATSSSVKSTTSSIIKSTTTSATKSATTLVVSTSAAGGGSGGGIITPTAVTTVFPSATGETMLPAPTTITGVFDGKMARWHRTSADVCQGQTETGVKDTIFVLADGATLANVIIGKNQAEGVHCLGTCTLINVWHEEVCEDAMTFKQASGTSYVYGGGARNADDKIMQFNGSGKVVVKHFYAENFGKLMRHCGTCGVVERHSSFEGIVANKGKIVVGINTNSGDTATISNSCLKAGTKFGDYFKSVSSGEPTKLGSCPFGTSCVGTNIVTDC